jgi:threonine-phosphate decarboxylase
MLHGHGNDLHHQQFKVKADFSSNVAPVGMPEALAEHLHKHLHLLGNYPEADAAVAATAIARHHNIDPAQVIVTNGSTEAFYLVAQLFRGQASLILTPSFAEYEDAGRCHQHTLTFLPHQQLVSELPGDYAAVWIANPNNPDGYTWAPGLIKEHCRQNLQTYFIVDESYANLCPTTQSLIEESMPPNLIVVRSLTKDFGLPGLRAGYLVAAPEIVKSINCLRMPWSVNALAQEAIGFIMTHYRTLLPDTSAILEESQRVQKMLADLPQLQVTPSDCNYFLVETKVSDAADLKHFLLQNHGFLIRDASNFRTLSPQHFRLAVLSPGYNNQLISALQSWISQVC